MPNLVDLTGRPEFFRRETEEQWIWERGEGEGFRKNEGRVGCHPHILYERIIKNKKAREKERLAEITTYAISSQQMAKWTND